MLQCVAVCCSVVQCSAVQCIELLKAFLVQIEGEKDWLTAAGDSNTLGESREKKEFLKSQHNTELTVELTFETLGGS